MCPNCVLNNAALGTGIYIAFGICGLFFLIGVVGVWWAFRNGEFEDLEGVKFEMLDDGEDNQLSAKAKAAVEKMRTQST
jgi:cbb3-type cytochrome oxidase maturation protein